jgi:hypothetical protein
MNTEQNFKKLMGASINCWMWNYHSALPYVSDLVTSGQVELTQDTNTEEVALNFVTEEHEAESVASVLHCFQQFIASDLDLDTLGIENEDLWEAKLSPRDLVELINGDAVKIARLLKEAQSEFINR